MAIEVKHGARPGSTIFARFGGAEGQAMRKALAGFLRARERSVAQDRSEDFRRELTGIAHEQDLEKMAITQDQRFALSERQGQYDLERQRIRNVGRQEEIADRYDAERGLIDYQFTAEQKDRDAKIRQALSVIEYDETLTPEDRAESRRLLAYELAGIEPLPKRKEPGPGIDELVQYHEGTGASFLTDPSTGKLTEVKGGGMSEGDAWKLALGATTGEGGVMNVEAARELVGEMMRGTQGGQQGRQRGQRALGAPVDEQTQAMLGRLKELQGEGPDIGRITLKDAEPIDSEDIPDIPDIPTTQAHLRVTQRELEVHQKKPIARKKGPSEKQFNPRSGAGQRYRRERGDWEEKEKKLIAQIEKFKNHLQALQREDRLIRANLNAAGDIAEINIGMRQ